MDLRDQHLGQHNACNLEDSSSHFRLQNRLFTLNSLCRASQGPSEGCRKAHLAQGGNVSKLDESVRIVSLEVTVCSYLCDHHTLYVSLPTELITELFSQSVANTAFNGAFN